MVDHRTVSVQAVDEVDVGPYAEDGAEELFHPLRIGFHHRRVLGHLAHPVQSCVQDGVGFEGDCPRQGQVGSAHVGLQLPGGQPVEYQCGQDHRPHEQQVEGKQLETEVSPD